MAGVGGVGRIGRIGKIGSPGTGGGAAANLNFLLIAYAAGAL